MQPIDESGIAFDDLQVRHLLGSLQVEQSLLHERQAPETVKAETL
jgi:hypothetical protein